MIKFFGATHTQQDKPHLRQPLEIFPHVLKYDHTKHDILFLHIVCWAHTRYYLLFNVAQEIEKRRLVEIFTTTLKCFIPLVGFEFSVENDEQRMRLLTFKKAGSW